jgi:hypothetical protein
MKSWKNPLFLMSKAEPMNPFRLNPFMLKKEDKNIGCQRKLAIFSTKIGKIAENNYHNIDDK